jgi:hypothetical protein
MADTRTTTWHELRVGDWIFCPVDGQPERIVWLNPRPNKGTIHVRTSRDDHPNRSAGGEVEVQAEQP